MCGIAGMILKRDVAPDRIERFLSSCDLMHHRGPDHKGVFRDHRVVLVHYRLSIIDLRPEANQPFHSRSGRLVTAYNGEIYNFRALAKSKGIDARTRSDTEIMLESFEREGSSVISDWNGIFALAIHDRSSAQLHLIRDRFGVKPLYYFETDDAFLFASEAKVIFDWVPEFQIRPDALAQFMTYGYCTGTDGFIEGLQRIAPGQHLTIDAGTGRAINSSRYWSVQDLPQVSATLPEAVDRTRALLNSALERQMVSDVPIGLFLSGGIDSSTIAALAQTSCRDSMDAYSIEYDVNVGGESEMARARLVAERFGLRHQELTLRAEHVRDIFADVVFQYDEPFADPASVALYQLASISGVDRRVVLQGDGGDELFAGYRRYNVLAHQKLFRLLTSAYWALPNSRFRQRLQRLNSILATKGYPQLIADYLTEETSETSPSRMLGKRLQHQLTNYTGQEDYLQVVEELSGLNPVQQLLYTDVSILLPYKYLEKVDKATMRFSVESRVPFLDNELTEYVLSLPASMKVRYGSKKHILKKAMRGTVPDSILFGKKRGFDVPVRAWMSHGLHEHAGDLFSDADPDFINKNNALQALSAYRKGELESVPLLWKTMVLAQWLHHYRRKLVL